MEDGGQLADERETVEGDRDGEELFCDAGMRSQWNAGLIEARFGDKPFLPEDTGSIQAGVSQSVWTCLIGG